MSKITGLSDMPNGNRMRGTMPAVWRHRKGSKMTSLFLEVKAGRERRRQAQVIARRERKERRRIRRRVAILTAVNRFLQAVGL